MNKPARFLAPRSSGARVVLAENPTTPGDGPEPSIGLETGAMWFNLLQAADTYKLYFASIARYTFDQSYLTLPANPVSNMHAATKQYVDNAAALGPSLWVQLSVGSSTNEWSSTGIARAKTMLGGAFAHLNVSNTVRDSSISANSFRNRFIVGMPTQFRPPQNLWVPALSSQTNAICFAQITTAGDINIYAQVAIPTNATVTLVCDYATTVGAPP
jgi:hypothetical protein